MKALILNGEEKDGLSLKHISKSIKEELRTNDFEVNELLLKEKEIADCIGCFKCWVKTPGVCIIDDYGREVAAQVINSDLLVFLTPLIFGSYSYQLKKALDRILPLISPYFKKINGDYFFKYIYLFVVFSVFFFSGTGEFFGFNINGIPVPLSVVGIIIKVELCDLAKSL